MKNAKMALEITARGLAKVFAKYKYFGEEQKNTEVYGVLMDVYSALPAALKDKLFEAYKAEEGEA